jgi:hypothetical protein
LKFNEITDMNFIETKLGWAIKCCIKYYRNRDTGIFDSKVSKKLYEFHMITIILSDESKFHNPMSFFKAFKNILYEH